MSPKGRRDDRVEALNTVSCTSQGDSKVCILTEGTRAELKLQARLSVLICLCSPEAVSGPKGLYMGNDVILCRVQECCKEINIIMAACKQPKEMRREIDTARETNIALRILPKLIIFLQFF